MPLEVSGVLPVHNEAGVLDPVLRSIERQTRKVDELIVVLDRCTDRSESVAEGRASRLLQVDFGNTGASVAAGVKESSGSLVVLFDGNTVVPPDYVDHVLSVLLGTHSDLVEWHGGMMAFPRITCERFGPFSTRYLWTLEYFLRVQANGGKVVRMDAPFTRLRPSPLARNVRYGRDYADLSEEYGLPPYFRIGTKSGWVPDSVAFLGAALGHVRHRRFLHSLLETGRYLRSG